MTQGAHFPTRSFLPISRLLFYVIGIIMRSCAANFAGKDRLPVTDLGAVDVKLVLLEQPEFSALAGAGCSKEKEEKRREEKRVFVFVLPPRAQQRPRASQVAVSHKYGERVGHIAAQF